MLIYPNVVRTIPFKKRAIQANNAVCDLHAIWEPRPTLNSNIRNLW